MILTTKRLLLRRWMDSDAEDLYQLAKDPDVGPIAGWPPHQNVEESRAIIANVLNAPEAYAICLKEEGRAIGAIELKLYGHTDLAQKEDECELGYWLGKPFWGRGIMPEAAREMLRRAFEDLGMSKVWCGYYEGNAKSRRVQEKCGFRYQWTTQDVDVPLMHEKRTGHVNLFCREDWHSTGTPVSDRRCVIIGGADIHEYEIIRGMLREDDFFVFCDSGLKHLEALGVIPDLIVGDFDSYENPHMNVETIVIPCEKDDTDTVFAVKEAIKRGHGEFLLIGVIGGRLDHSLGNVSILLYLDSLGKNGSIADDYSEMQIVSKTPAVISGEYPYFSLLNVTGCAKDICIRNAKYPLENAEITCEYQYGISNEVLPGQEAVVSVGCGRLLLLKIRTG